METREKKQSDNKSIRFIDSHYNEKFRICDGDRIRITMSDGSSVERTCHYIDDYHLYVGNLCFHICEFAERMEKNGNKVEPINQSEPPDKTRARNKEKER